MFSNIGVIEVVRNSLFIDGVEIKFFTAADVQEFLIKLIKELNNDN